MSSTTSAHVNGDRATPKEAGRKRRRVQSRFRISDYDTLVVDGEGTIEDHSLCDYLMDRNREELESLRSKLATCRREYLELEERYEKLSDAHSQCPYWIQRKEGQAMAAMEKLEEITQELDEAEKRQSERQT